eukprot:1325079-Amorphochlora_amoeboformis.AAC.2
MKAKSAPPARYPRVWRWIVCIFTIHTIQSTHPKLSTPKIPIQNFKSTRFLFSFFRIRAGFGTSGHSLGPFEDRENDDKSDVDFDFDFSGSSVAEALKHYQDHTRRTSRAASLRFDGDESNESNERDDRNSGTPSRRNNAGGRMRGRSAKARASSRRGYREHGHRIRGQSHILGSSGRGVGGVAAGTGGGDTSKNDHTRRFKDMLKMVSMFIRWMQGYVVASSFPIPSPNPNLHPANDEAWYQTRFKLGRFQVAKPHHHAMPPPYMPPQ